MIIIGNYTALVGDPSGRDETRSKLTQEQVEANAVDYLMQVGRIIDLSKAEVHKNGDWFSTVELPRGPGPHPHDDHRPDDGPRGLRQADRRPKARLFARVPLSADAGLGLGRDQGRRRAGRDRAALQLAGGAETSSKAQGQEPQVAMTMPILVGTDGTRRMGKSLGNYIGVAETAESQFGKIMSVPDEPMRQYFTLLTELPLAEVERLLAPGINPRDAKEVLGKVIVAQYHGEPRPPSGPPWSFAAARRARTPTISRVVELAADKLDADGRIPAFVLLKELGLETSTSNARRVIEQGGMNVGPNRDVITDPKALFTSRTA